AVHPAPHMGRPMAARRPRLEFESDERHWGLGRRRRLAIVGTALPGPAVAIEAAGFEIEGASRRGIALWRRVLRTRRYRKCADRQDHRSQQHNTDHARLLSADR